MFICTSMRCQQILSHFWTIKVTFLSNKNSNYKSNYDKESYFSYFLSKILDSSYFFSSEISYFDTNKLKNRGNIWKIEEIRFRILRISYGQYFRIYEYLKMMKISLLIYFKVLRKFRDVGGVPWFGRFFANLS